MSMGPPIGFSSTDNGIAQTCEQCQCANPWVSEAQWGMALAPFVQVGSSMSSGPHKNFGSTVWQWHWPHPTKSAAACASTIKSPLPCDIMCNIYQTMVEGEEVERTDPDSFREECIDDNDDEGLEAHVPHDFTQSLNFKNVLKCLTHPTA
ncbi:hypothetical protein EI94DRAFT_1701990 [Lactarius quietus]|nr:hypothetical protein EI94DRAFT_1701990 [Lactarius quietus]